MDRQWGKYLGAQAKRVIVYKSGSVDASYPNDAGEYHFEYLNHEELLQRRTKSKDDFRALVVAKSEGPQLVVEVTAYEISNLRRTLCSLASAIGQTFISR
jgi:hypothetical protein